MKKIDWLVVLFFLLASAFTLKDLFLPNFYTSHDGVHQVVRLYYFDQAIRDGQMPPRWAGGLLNGFGYPLFLFSYHFPWFIAEPLYAAGLSIFQSIKMTFLIGYAVSGVAMYFYLRAIYGRSAAFLGGCLYLFAPYRFSNIFVRAAIGDATAFLFFPLIFWSLYELRTGVRVDWRWITLGALAQAGLLLSHAMVFFLFELFVGLYVLGMFFSARSKKTFTVSVTVMMVLGLGIAAYYFVPSFLERDNTKFAQVMSSVFTDSTYVSLSRLVYSRWGYGVMDAAEGAMSLQIGIAQWVTVGLGLLTIGWFITKGGKRRWQEEGIFFVGVFGISVLLMQQVSAPFWRIIHGILIVDFTWRVLVVSVFAAAVAAAYVVARWRWGIAVGFLLFILAIIGNRHHLRINEERTWELPFYLQLEKTTNSYDEYTPLWVNSDVVKIKKPPVEFSVPAAQVGMYRKSSNMLDFSINTPQTGTAVINTIYYPGWSATVNGKHQSLAAADGGRMAVSLAAGVSRVTLKFIETPLRRISDGISVASLLVLALMLYLQQRLWK